MWNVFRYGPPKKVVDVMVILSWPVMTAAKKWSSLPVLKWIINPFFKAPYNELTSIPVNARITPSESNPVPRKVLERLVSQIEDIFILDDCFCRRLQHCRSHPADIGCLALGPAISRMHPSHGRHVGADEAIQHVRRASDAGLVANLGHVWIDVVAFGLPDFKNLMFICFCDDCCCQYRTHLKKRGPNLDRAYQKLPGVNLSVINEKCNGCGICKEKCFVDAIALQDNVAVVTDSCKGCGQCVDNCPEQAIVLELTNEEELYEQLKSRLYQQSEIRFNEPN